MPDVQDTFFEYTGCIRCMLILILKYAPYIVMVHGCVPYTVATPDAWGLAMDY